MEPDPIEDLYASLADYMAAPQAARERRPRVPPKHHVTLSCGDCGHRITWWTEQVRSVPLGLQDVSHRGWKWQGQGASAVSFRGELVDVSCTFCGWQRNGVARQVLPSWWLAPPEIV